MRKAKLGQSPLTNRQLRERLEIMELEIESLKIRLGLQPEVQPGDCENTQGDTKYDEYCKYIMKLNGEYPIKNWW